MSEMLCFREEFGGDPKGPHDLLLRPWVLRSLMTLEVIEIWCNLFNRLTTCATLSPSPLWGIRPRQWEPWSWHHWKSTVASIVLLSWMLLKYKTFCNVDLWAVPEWYLRAIKVPSNVITFARLSETEPAKKFPSHWSHHYPFDERNRGCHWWIILKILVYWLSWTSSGFSTFCPILEQLWQTRWSHVGFPGLQEAARCYKLHQFSS